MTLFGDAVLPPSAQGPVRVPLTMGQRARSLTKCLPGVAFALMVAGYLVLASCGIIPPPVPLFYLFIAVVFLFTGHQALQSLRDLASSFALIQEDLLTSPAGRRGRVGAPAGIFERLGRMRMTPKAYFQNSPGQRYRVVYSPVSKIVWALGPPDVRVR